MEKGERVESETFKTKILFQLQFQNHILSHGCSSVPRLLKIDANGSFIK